MSKQTKAKFITLTVAVLSAATATSQIDIVFDSCCSAADHTGVDCSHKRPANPGLCWNGPGGQGFSQCAGQEPNHCPNGGVTYYQVEATFPQSEIDNVKGNCTPADSTGVVQFWATHTFIQTNPQNCYRIVTCTWSGGKCIVASGGAQQWVSLGKKESVSCGPLTQIVECHL